MDRDEILRQGKDAANKLRDEAGAQVAKHEDQIKDVLSKVVGFVNDQTGGRYAERIDKVAAFVEREVDKLADSGRSDRGPDTPPPTTPPPTTPPPTTPPPTTPPPTTPPPS